MVTIITDASLSPHTDKAAWAGKIICNRGKLGGSGGLYARSLRSTGAEMLATWNTVWLAQSKGLLLPGDRLILQNDNSRVVRLIEWAAAGEKPERSREQRENDRDTPIWWMEQMFWSFLIDLGVTITPRHVKGHLAPGMRERRHHVQDECDREAKSARLTFERKKLARGYRALRKIDGKIDWVSHEGRPFEHAFREDLPKKLDEIGVPENERKVVPWWVE